MIFITKIYVVILFTALLMSGLSSHAQTSLLGSNTRESFLNNSKPKLSVSLSSSFTSFGAGYNSFGTSVMPEITFPVSPRFSLSTGIGYSTFFMGNGSEGMFNSNPSSYGHVYVSGSYLVNEKVTLSGTAYKTFLLGSSNYGNETVPPLYDFSSQGFIMDVEYKVTDSFRINVSFEYRDQNYPVYGPGINPTNPFMGNSSPFQGFNHRSNF